MKRAFAAATTAFALLFLTHTTSATLINITGSDLLPDYLTPASGGNIAPRTTSQGDEQVFEWLMAQAGVYGYAEPKNLVLASGDGTSEIDFSLWSGHYLVLHWGNGPANQLFEQSDRPKGGFDQAFYISPEGDNRFGFELPALTNEDTQTTKNVGGLSFWRVYDPPTTVPDAAPTLGLLAFAFCLMLFINAKCRQPLASTRE